MTRPLLFLGACLLTSLVVCSRALAIEDRHKRPFRSIKAPKETIVNYEAIFPKITFQESKQAHPKLLHVSIPTLRHNYSLVLELNEQLISSSFTSRSFDEEGHELVTKGHVNRFYQGWVEGHPDWRVAMSTCHGLQGSFGDRSDKKNFFHLEPLGKDVSLEQLHAFYPDSEYTHKQGNCGCNHSHALSSSSRPYLRQSHSHSRLRRQGTTQRIVEWVAVNDARQYEAYDRNLSMTVMRALAIANEVDSLYRELMIRIALIESITWTKGDQIEVTSHPDTLLNRFRKYRPKITTPHDSAMLFTGIDLDNNTLGVAFVSEMCSETNSVGLTQDGGNSLSVTASIAAHELGHILNMNHDDPERQCSCADGDQGCIMAAVQGFPPPTRWSSCSISDLNTGFTIFNSDRCLSNQPSMSVGDPVCGNGIREGSEVCDCGSAQECTDPCCNAATCQLATVAQCSAGACCSSSCRFVSYGTQCRAAMGDCDVAEYCPGDSGECPFDDHQRNGISCSNDTGYCYGGMCPTHDAQCQVAFGSNKGVDRCYSEVNVKGNVFGNCGHSSTSFRACSPDDAQCGQLQCMSGEFMLDNLPGITTPTYTIGSDECRSFTTRPNRNTDIENPGLVEDGTRCGNGLVCRSQRCVTVSGFTTAQCTTAPSGQICSGNGVCNNRRTCSCDVGFTGAICETPYTGPEDSQGGSKSNSGAVAGAVIGTLLGLALLAGVVVGVILVIKFRNKASNYSPPSRVKTFTPSVKVVRPGKYNAGHRAPSTSTPSAPPRSVTGNSWSSPPRPVTRPPPPKPPSHAPPRPPPPTNHPAVKPHPVTQTKPPTQASSKSTDVRGRWPPMKLDSAAAKPSPPSMKPIIPPRPR